MEFEFRIIMTFENEEVFLKYLNHSIHRFFVEQMIKEGAIVANANHDDNITVFDYKTP